MLRDCHGYGMPQRGASWETGGGLRRVRGSDDRRAAIRLPPASSDSSDFLDCNNTHRHHVNSSAAPLVFESGGPGQSVIGSGRSASRRPQRICEQRQGVIRPFRLVGIAVMQHWYGPPSFGGANDRDLSPHAWLGTRCSFFFFSSQACSAPVRFFRPGGLRGKGDKSPRANLRQP
jgi:hypothetical protein